jgi:hypothetical protein
VPALIAGPGYYEALNIQVRGSSPTWTDEEKRAGVVVISAALAKRLWPAEDPIGKGIRCCNAKPPFYHVIGVTGDVLQVGLDSPPTEAVYFPVLPAEEKADWGPPRTLNVVVKTRTGHSAALARAMRSVARELDPTVVMGPIQSLQELAQHSIVRRTLTMGLLGVASAMALLLSAIGLYGALAYIVGLRRTEIAIRMALGATSSRVAMDVLANALWLASAGAAIGLAGAWVSGRALQTLVFGVGATDPLTLLVATATLLLTAGVASVGPARSAAAEAPANVLRSG